LAYTRADVHSLNTRARELRRAAGELGAGEMIETSRGAREFATGDRLYFLRNERSLGVKNGSLGTVERIRDEVLQVRLDGQDERRIVVDPRFYSDLDHGYAATVHKTQGTTVDRTYVLATPHFDRHSTYVALSRHREAATLFDGPDDFRAGWREHSVEDKFKAALSRARPKELAHDFLERDLLSAQPSRLEQAIQRVIERQKATDLTTQSVCASASTRSRSAWRPSGSRNGPLARVSTSNTPRSCNATRSSGRSPKSRSWITIQGWSCKDHIQIKSGAG